MGNGSQQWRKVPVVPILHGDWSRGSFDGKVLTSFQPQIWEQKILLMGPEYVWQHLCLWPLQAEWWKGEDLSLVA